MKTSFYIALALGISAGAVFAADTQTGPSEIAQAGQAAQGAIQGDSRKLVAEIDATIDEYERNGLKGDEIDNLKKLREILSNMSDREMAKILDLLQQAGAKSDPKDSLKALVDAYSAQKGVLTKLQQILNEYATEQDALNLVKQVRALADRQAVNLQTGIETAQWTLAGGNRENNAAAADFSMQAQASEQKAIADELKQLQAKIAAMAANPDNQALAERFKKGLDEIAKLNPILDSATDLLNQKKLFDAAVGEKSARDGLRLLARLVSPPRDDADALLEASQELEKIISLQKDLVPATDASKLLPIEQWIAAQLQQKGNVRSTAMRLRQQDIPPAQLAQMDVYKSLYREQLRLAKERLSGLENQEGDISNQTDSLSQDIASILKPAADALQSAIPPMQAAQGGLVDGDGATAVKSENDALAWMEKARALIDQKLAGLEQAEKTGDTAASPAELQKQAQELLAGQTAIAKDTALPETPAQTAALAQQQAALEQKTQDLQKQAAATSPQAAQSLDAAAKNMQQAATAMNAPGQNMQAQSQQQQALQNLAAAGQQLGQQAAQQQQAEQQAEQQAAADQKELDALAKIIENEQKLQLDTVEAIPKEKKSSGTIGALAPRQQGIQQDTNDFQKTLTGQAGGADPKLIASASAHMGDAAGHLGKAEGPQAAPDEKKALDDLYAAENALEAAMQAAQNQAGDTPPEQAQQAAAAAAIAQAQQQAAQAMQAMAQQNNAGQQAATNDFAQAAQTAGNAGAQNNALPGDAQQALQAANQDLTQAAGEEAAGQGGQAKQSGQQAQAELAQAQAAMAQAQAGLAENGQGQGQGQGQGGQASGGSGNTGITGAQTQGNGQRTASKTQFVGLPPRDRATIEQSQAEKYPQQYATKVEQYLQNLADESDKH